jgi:hypothetical protein
MTSRRLHSALPRARSSATAAWRSARVRSRASRWLATAEELEAEGRLLEATDALTEANRLRRRPEIERRLVRLRHEAAVRTKVGRGDRPWPVMEPRGTLPTSGDGLPVVASEELTPEVVSTGILRHGCVHIRRMLPEPVVANLVRTIDRAFAAYDAHASGASEAETTPWFEPFHPGSSYSREIKRQFNYGKRGFVRDAGGVWAADSPRGLFELFEAFHDVGLAQLIRAYLGERPALAFDKCTFRRVGQLTGSDWHQDGAFLGEGVRVINVWMALSHCGRDAPGLDLVPCRLDDIVETGTEGATFNWTVGPGVVERVSVDAPVRRPIFEPGDVLLFDDFFLHRTAIDPTMTRERYAVETWFFAPSVFPDHYIPLAF